MAQDIPLRDIAQQCKTAFAGCLAYEVLDEAGIRSAQGNFNLWCAELKVTSPDERATLDYRLRKKDKMRNVIRNLLRGLLGALGNCQRLCDAITETGDEREEKEFEDQDDKRNDKGSEETRQGCGSNGQQNPMTQDRISDESEPERSNASSDDDSVGLSALDEQLRYVRTIIDQLTWSSLNLRQAGNNYRFEEADTDFDERAFDDFRKHLTALILRAHEDPGSKYLTAREKSEMVTDHKRLNTVQKRLVHANLLRRNRIQWATKNRLSKPALIVDPPEKELATPKHWKSSRISASSTSSTRETTPSFAAGSSRITLPTLGETVIPLRSAKTATDVNSGLTVKDILPQGHRSTATQMTKITAKQEYPRQPTLSGDGSLRCPYCDKLLPLDFANPEHKSTWTNHIVYDIVPYQCVLEACDTAEEMYLTSLALRTHMLAKHSVERWICDYCNTGHCKDGHVVEDNNIQMFATAADWQTHISIEHAGIIPVEYLTTFAKMNKAVVIGPLQCPLCPYETRGPDTDIDDHILRHLHAFALQSLTDGIAGGSRDQSIASSVSRSMTSGTGDDGHVLTYPTFPPEDVQRMLNQQWRALTNGTHDSTPIPAVQSPPHSDPAVLELWNVEAELLVAILHASLSLCEDFVEDLTQLFAASPTEHLQELRETALEAIAQMNSIATRPTPSIVGAPKRKKAFLHHDTALMQMRQNRRKLGSRTALVGLGGVGKTRLALDFAYQVHQELPRPWVFWINAITAVEVERGFRDIAASVGITDDQNPMADIFQLVRDWLCKGTNGPWVLILDGVHDIEILTRTSSMSLMSDLQYCQRGFILVTTRDINVASELVGSPNAILIHPMNESDALQLLEHSLQGPATGDDAVELVNTLQLIPLAIAMAGSFISSQSPPCSIREYLNLYQNHTVSSTLDADMRSSLPRAFKSIWQLSFENIELIRPSATELLFLMSFCHGHGIPENLIRYQRQSIQPVIEKTLIKGREGDDDSFLDRREALSAETEAETFNKDTLTLQQFSLIHKDEGGATFTVHILVQRATLEWLEANGLKEHWRYRFLRNLDAVLPRPNHEDRAEWETLFPHVRSAAAETPEERESLKVWATVLYRTAWYNLDVGDVHNAERLSVMAMRARIDLFGEQHEDTEWALERVARTYCHVGRFDKAEKLFNRVMEARQERLGSAHPDTLTSMENLAATYYHQSQLDKAEKLGELVLETRQKELRVDHPDLLASAHSLASTYHLQGQLDKAEKLGEFVLETRQMVLGSDHRDTLTSMDDLASTYRLQGRLDKAERLATLALEIRESKMGSDHLATLIKTGHLAIMRRELGRLKEAEGMMEHCVEQIRTQVGAEHNEHSIFAATLAHWKAETGQHR